MKRIIIAFMVITISCLCAVTFAKSCPSLKQVAKDYPMLKIHKYIRLPHRHGWEAAINHLSSRDTVDFEYVQINPDAPQHDGVKCIYSTFKGDQLSIFYRKVGEFETKGKNWEMPLTGGPTCGDYNKTIHNPAQCQFKVKKK